MLGQSKKNKKRKKLQATSRKLGWLKDWDIVR